MILDFEGKLEKEAATLEKELEDDIEKVERVIDNKLWGRSNQNKLDSLAQKLQSRPLNDPRPAVE